MESVQDLINFILWDRRLVRSPDGRTFVILNPTVGHRNIAALEKTIVLEQAIDAETPTEDKVMADARVGESWTDEDDLILKEGEKHIAFLEAEKLKQKFLAKKRKLDEQISETKAKLQDVLERKQYLYTMSAEYLAHEASVYSLLEQTVYNRSGEPFFNQANSMSSVRDHDRDLMNFLIREVMSEGLLPHADIRKISRSVEWRMLWTLNREDLRGLFNTPISDLSANQKMLIYWSRVYDLAFESTDRPDDEIIQDDIKFDTWLQNRSNEKTDSMDAKKRGIPDHHEQGVVLDGYYIDTCSCGVGTAKSKGHGEKPRHASDCQFGIYKRYTREEKDKIADEIYGRNGPKVRAIQTQEQNTVASVGLIDEKDLVNKKARIMLGSKQSVHRING
jgi:hypothetical protein